MNYVYLVDTKGMTPEERTTAEAHMEMFGEVFTTPNSMYGIPARFFVITECPPDKFAVAPHPDNFPWQDATGWDLTKI